MTTERTEIPAAAKICGWIDMLHPGKWAMRRREEIGVSRAKVLSRWAPAVTPVAVGLSVDDVAAQADQSSISWVIGEGNRRDCQADLDLALILIVIRLRPCADAGSLERHQQNGDYDGCH